MQKYSKMKAEDLINLISGVAHGDDESLVPIGEYILCDGGVVMNAYGKPYSLIGKSIVFVCCSDNSRLATPKTWTYQPNSSEEKVVCLSCSEDTIYLLVHSYNPSTRLVVGVK